MTTRLVGVLCLVLLAFGPVGAELTVVCPDEKTCDCAVDPLSSHCGDEAAVVSACCLDRGGSGEVGVRPPRSPIPNDNLVVEAETVAPERVLAPLRTLDASASEPLATPSPALYRIHAALLL